MPVKAVAKKRGQTFAFVEFRDTDEKKRFMDEFTVHPKKRNIRLGPLNKPLSNSERNRFKQVKSQAEMLEDS